MYAASPTGRVISTSGGYGTGMTPFADADADLTVAEALAERVRSETHMTPTTYRRLHVAVSNRYHDGVITIEESRMLRTVIDKAFETRVRPEPSTDLPPITAPFVVVCPRCKRVKCICAMHVH